VTATPKRRWYQFSLWTLIVATTGVAVLLSWPYIRRQNNCWRLQRYVGKNLLVLTDLEQKELNSCVEAVVGPAAPLAPGKFSSFQNWVVCQFSDRGGAPRVFVIQVAPGFGLDSDTFMRIFFVDQFGRVVRVDTVKIHVGLPVLDKGEHGFPCLCIEDAGVRWDRLKYYYSLAGDQIELIRVESHEGQFALPGNGKISYGNRNWPESKQLLMSTDVCGQLRALACLASISFDLPSTLENNHRLRLRELSKSPDPWVKEEALAFLEILEPPAESKDSFEKP
jgi:hypothetical protein